MTDYNYFRLGREGKGEALAFTGTSTQSAAFPSGIRAVRLVSEQDVHIVIGADPTATTSDSFFLPAYVVEYVLVQPNEKIAAIASGTGGNLFIDYATR